MISLTYKFTATPPVPTGTAVHLKNKIIQHEIFIIEQVKHAENRNVLNEIYTLACTQSINS